MSSDPSSGRPAPLSDATHGLFFTYDFGPDGFLCAEGAARAWTFRAYMTSDIRTRQAVAADAAHHGFRNELRGVVEAARQVARTGTDDQIDRARAALGDARKALYRILAEDVPADD